MCKMVFLYLLYWKIGGSMKVICNGVLQVEPGAVVHVGSELTVLCRSYAEHCGRHFSISLNRQAQGPLQVLNCSTVKLRLANITSNARLICRVSRSGDGMHQTVCGMDLQAGFPPEKPTGLRCYALRESDNVSCTWNKGRETHILTKYTATFQFKNGTQSFHQRSHNTSSLHVPWSLFRADIEYSLSVRAQNDLGEVVSDAIPLSLKDIVIPNTPRITMVEFGNGSMTATLHWNISESSGLWRAKVRLGDATGHTEFWGTEPSQGLVLLEDLRPLSRYELQIQACSAGENPKCSQWSPPVQCMSPATAPATKLDVWRILRGIQENGTRSVTILWKHPTPEYTAVTVGHELVYQERGRWQTVTCAANVTERTLHVSPEVMRIFIRAVTSAGKSPPAVLQISQTSLAAPRVKGVAPVGESSVLLTWELYRHQNESTLGYIVQWQGTSLSHTQEVQWKRLAAGHNSTRIEGLEPGVRFNVSLYAVSSAGASHPAFCQAYSREEKPLSGPKVSLLNVEATRMLIQWEELGLDQRRGFITNYTIYMRKHNTGQQLILAGAMSRHMWLNGLDATFNLHVSASNSAGEGPLGEGVLCQLQGSTKDGSNIGPSLVIAVPLVILANLMCWDCVRRRIKRTCTTVGPQWLFEKFPRVENSTATKLLQHKERSDSDSSWRSMYDDPPISPVEIVPAAQRTDWCPSGRGEGIADTWAEGRPSPGEPETGPLLEEEHAYKPQITSAALEEDFPEEEDNPWATPSHGPIPGDADATCGLHVSSLLRDWLSDGSGAGLSTTGGIHFKGMARTVLAAGSWPEEGLSELGRCPQDLHLLPDQLVSCLRGPAIEPPPDSSGFPQGIVLHVTQSSR
ncbi:hypothetical protein AAFF_G00074640 [Aldrovandia affinis]|uniref:Fibronectin type-III domain-containing protein n=1 Tax=Aldrovandia affinis TaxID=143900 RepID=A0AAD7S0W1_9TELE|nr:hypothetical protein AAFF_G00074640 [Aldrovandia affinis]